MSTRKWPDLESFAHMVRNLRRFAPQTGKMTFRGKVKLHGTNAAVRLRNGGVEAYQSRERDITPDDDNAGFARWASGVDWSPVQTAPEGVTVIHGEWAGAGVQKTTVVSTLPKKFFVFAVEYCNDEVGGGGDWTSRVLVTEPEEITRILSGFAHPDVFVLPWEGPALDVDFTSNSLTAAADAINAAVAQVEGCDPYIKEVFGVEGEGEGLVYYPLGVVDRNVWKPLAFKAKGERHSVKAVKAPATVSVEVLANVEAFVQAFVTPARCEQGASTIGGVDIRNMGSFLAWVAKDVEKESKVELEESNLTWKQVGGAVTKAARDWYKAQCEKV